MLHTPPVTLTGSLTVKYLNSTKKMLLLALNIGAQAYQASGNLYGSSKDIGLHPKQITIVK